MATHSSILAWRIPWTEEPGGLQSMGLQELNKTEWLSLSLYFSCQQIQPTMYRNLDLQLTESTDQKPINPEGLLYVCVCVYIYIYLNLFSS